MGDIMNGFAGGALGTAGNIVSTLIANDANKELVRERNQMAIDQWNRENAYNSPQAMVKRLRDAGLNPAMMYENGPGSLSASSSPDLQAAKVAAPQVDPLTMAQINLLNKEADLRESQREKTDVETGQSKESFPIMLDKLNSEVGYLNSRQASEDADANLKKALTGESYQRAKNLFQDYTFNSQRFIYDLSILSSKATIERETAFRIADQLEKSIQNLWSSSVLMHAQTYKANNEGAVVYRDSESRRIAANAQASQANTAFNRSVSYQQSVEQTGFYQFGTLSARLRELDERIRHNEKLEAHWLRQDMISIGREVIDLGMDVFKLTPYGRGLGATDVIRNSVSRDAYGRISRSQSTTTYKPHF